jgi:hypothetical protein
VDRSEFFTILLESKNMTVCSREIPFSGEFQLSLEQLSAEHPPPPPSNRIPQEGSHFVALPAGATSPLLLRSRTTTTTEQIALRVILLHLLIQAKNAPAILKKFEFKMNFKLKIKTSNRIVGNLDLSNEPICNLPQSCETILLKTM